MEPRRYLIPPNDEAKSWRFCRLAKQGILAIAEEATKEGKTAEIIMRPVREDRSDPQRNTLWMWCTQVASELSIRTSRRWTKDDVYETVFIDRFMPTYELVLPDGEVVTRQMRTGDKPPEGDERSTRQIVSSAMTDFLRWIYEMQIEVTVPEDSW